MTREGRGPFAIADAKFAAAIAPGSGAEPPPTFVEIAFAGKSNVGKSSLINALVGRKGLVRTSGTPGCTRQINLFEVRARDGSVFALADLPGYGFAKRSKEERRAWADLVERYIAERPSLRVLVVVADARRGFEADDLDLVDFARRARKHGLSLLAIVPVATKVDRLPKSSARATLDRLGARVGGKVVGFSAVTGQGWAELWRALRGASGMLPLATEATKRHNAAASEPADARRGRVQGRS